VTNRLDVECRHLASRDGPETVTPPLHHVSGADSDLVDANLTPHLIAQALASGTRSMWRWHCLCLAQVLLGVPEREDKYLVVFPRGQHHRVLETLVAAQVGQDVFSEERDSLLHSNPWR
jgi:hypothetical protein